MKLSGPFLLLPLCMLAAAPDFAGGQTAADGEISAAGLNSRLKGVRTAEDYMAVAGYISQLRAKPETQLETVYALEGAAVSRLPMNPVRRAMVNDLTQFLEGTADAVRTGVLNRLAYSFTESDFDKSAAERVLKQYRANPREKAGILAAGIAAFDRIKPELTAVAAGEIKDPAAGRYYGAPAWAALLVLARNGDQPSLKKLIAAARNEQDVVVKTTLLVKDFQLVPRREIVEFLVEIAQSDERLPQVKATAPGELVSNRAIHALSTMLENPPALRDPSVPTSEERQAFRAWLSKPSHLKIKPSSTK